MTPVELPPLAIDPGPVEVERVMEELVYEHLIDLVDFDRMSELEDVVGLQLYEMHQNGQLGDGPENAIPARAAAILERAWHRAIKDPRRYVDFRGEWNPDDDCELCRALAESSSPAKPHRSPS